MTTNKFDKKLTVKSSTDNLALIRDFTKSAAEECGFGPQEVGKITLAVDEACTNVIKHAYKYSPEGEIVLHIKFRQPKFVILIKDKGLHFDPNAVPEPNIKVYHKEKRSGGLGMYLMKKLMDEVSYENLKENLNQVTLVKYLS